MMDKSDSSFENIDGKAQVIRMSLLFFMKRAKHDLSLIN